MRDVCNHCLLRMFHSPYHSRLGLPVVDGHLPGVIIVGEFREFGCRWRDTR
jgi:hypothetical protein